jgi:toxin ParE1/3/4
MIWKVEYAEHARLDLRDIYGYIAETLLEPETARKQTSRIMEAVDSLDYMPMRFRLYYNEPWRSYGLRVMPVDNYAVLYLPNDAVHTVTVIRVVYSRRDIDRELDFGIDKIKLKAH